MSQSTSHAGYRVLVAEDEALIAIDIATCLESAGFSVVGPFAELGEALQAAATDLMDVAVLDVNLRGVPVWPLADAMRARGIPFVFLTGYASLNDFPLEFAGVPRLDKPFVADQLLAVVARFARGVATDAPQTQPFDTGLPDDVPLLADAS